MIPGPVAVVVIAMRSVNCCSDPPLVAIPDISYIFGQRTTMVGVMLMVMLMVDDGDDDDDGDELTGFQGIQVTQGQLH